MICILCEEQTFKRIISFNNEKTDVVKCNNCGLVMLNPIVKPDKEGDDYKKLEIDSFYNYLKELRTAQFSKDMRIIQKYVPSGKLIDIGCSYGFFLDLAKKKGFQTIGIEPSKSVIDFCANIHSELEIIHGEFENIPLKKESFDVLTLWSVLEHMVDPSVIIERAASIIKKNGLIAIRVPNYDGLLSKCILSIYKLSCGKIDKPARSLYQMDYTYKHFYHFNRKTLISLLRKYHFEIIEYYQENSLNPKFLNKRVQSSKDMEFMKNPLIRTGVILLLKLSSVLNLQDEIVIFAKKI